MRLPVRLPPLRVEDHKSRDNVTQSSELTPSAVIVLAWRPRPPRTGSRGPFTLCTCPSSANCFSSWCSHQQDPPEARPQSSNKLWVVPKVLQACTTMRCQWSLPNSDEHQSPLTTAKVCDLLQRCVLEAESSSYGPCGHAQRLRKPRWALMKEHFVVFYQNAPHWCMLLSTGRFIGVEPKAEFGFRATCPVLANSTKATK